MKSEELSAPASPFVHRRLSIIFSLVLFFLLGIAAAEDHPARRLGHFNAGETIFIKVGERFSVTLERARNEDAIWIWPALPTAIVRLDEPEPTRAETDFDIEETWTFIGVAPGAADVFAELVLRNDHTAVRARYPIKVQVVL
jgi:hypothetical protein